MRFEHCTRDSKFYGIFFASMIIIGTGATYMFHIGKIRIYSNKSGYTATYVDLFWI